MSRTGAGAPVRNKADVRRLGSARHRMRDSATQHREQPHAGTVARNVGELHLPQHPLNTDPGRAHISMYGLYKEASHEPATSA